MSGIAAIYHRDGRPVDRADIDRVARALTMYGPERQSIRVLGNVAFAYTHFANTPEAVGSQQPVTGGGGRYTMVFDGRLDNRADLAGALGIDAEALRMMSDTHLAVRCWERWRTDAFNKWVGEFAVIIWDAAEQRLLAVRDQLGCRALSYHLRADRIVLASAPKGLHALADIPRAIDEQKLADALCQLYADGERGYFKDIRRVRTASVLTVGPESAETLTYYRLSENVRDVRYARDEDYVDAARDVLDVAVKSCLRSTGAVGSFMSGGLDSSTVAVTAARMLTQQGKRLPTYTWVPEPGWDGRLEKHCYGDETPYVEQIAAQHPGIELNLVDAAGLGHYHKQEELLHACEMPFRNALNVTWGHAILDKAKARGIKVMLEGGMGNLTLSYRGDGVYVHHWQQRNFRRLVKELLALDGVAGLPRHVLIQLAVPLGPEWLWAFKEWLRGRGGERNRWLRYVAANPKFARAMRIPARAQAAEFNFFGRQEADPRKAWAEATLGRNSGESGEARQGLTAMYGIEMRDPLADRRLFEWCLGVPEDQFHRDGRGRWLIRRLMRGVLPDAVLFKPRDLGRQVCDWHVRLSRDRDRMRSDLHALARDPDAARMIDVPRLSSMLDEEWPEQTSVDYDDDRRFLLPVNLPLALQAGRFVQRVKGINLGEPT
jgi:asparagine synthase (glutamine-hydrolysing)